MIALARGPLERLNEKWRTIASWCISLLDPQSAIFHSRFREFKLFQRLRETRIVINSNHVKALSLYLLERLVSPRTIKNEIWLAQDSFPRVRSLAPINFRASPRLLAEV